MTEPDCTVQAAPADKSAPPTPAALYAALMADFRPAGWEIYFSGSVWQAQHPAHGVLTSSSAIGLRDAIKTAGPPSLTPAEHRRPT